MKKEKYIIKQFPEFKTVKELVLYGALEGKDKKQYVYHDDFGVEQTKHFNEVYYDFIGLGQYFYEAEQAYGVNSVFLLSIAILESGWGKSTLAQTKNNLFGYQAYDNDPNKAMYFSSKAEAIHTVGSHLAKNYLRSDGKYYNGATPAGVNVMYCSGGEWASKVVSIMNKVMDSVPY